MADDDKKASEVPEPDPTGADGGTDDKNHNDDVEADDVEADDGEADDVEADDVEADDVEADDDAGRTAAASDAGSVTAADVTAADVAAASASPRMDLPKWNRSRVKRKAPKGEETDAFQEGVRSAGKRAVRRAPLVGAAIAALAGALALGIYLRGKSSAETASATQLLATAAAFEARGVVVDPDPERVRPSTKPTADSEAGLEAKISGALRELAASAADTPVHRVSRLVQAGRATRASDFPGAEAAYRAYLGAGGDPSLDFLAREGMVLAIEAQGRLDDALAELEPLLQGEDRGFFRDQALWHKGRLLEAKGEADSAVAVYRQYVEHFPLEESSFARDKVVERLTELDPEFTPPPSPQGLGAGQGLPFAP